MSSRHWSTGNPSTFRTGIPSWHDCCRTRLVATRKRSWCVLCCPVLSSPVLFRSTSKSRPNNIRGGGEMSVHPYVCTSVRQSTKSFFDLNEIWCIGRGRWVMHDGMPRSRSRSRALESLNSFHFQNLSPPPFTMGAGKWPLILKLEHNI